MKALLAGLVGFSLCMANISGIVTDTSGSIPLSGAAVQLEINGHKVTTGADGRFTLMIDAAVLPGYQHHCIKSELSATVRNNLLCLNIGAWSEVAVAAFDLTGSFLDFGYISYCWSATELDASPLAFFRNLKYDYDYLYRYSFSKRCGLSVRLLRD